MLLLIKDSKVSLCTKLNQEGEVDRDRWGPEASSRVWEEMQPVSINCFIFNSKQRGKKTIYGSGKEKFHSCEN